MKNKNNSKKIALFIAGLMLISNNLSAEEKKSLDEVYDLMPDAKSVKSKERLAQIVFQNINNMSEGLTAKYDAMASDDAIVFGDENFRKVFAKSKNKGVIQGVVEEIKWNVELREDIKKDPRILHAQFEPEEANAISGLKVVNPTQGLGFALSPEYLAFSEEPVKKAVFVYQEDDETNSLGVRQAVDIEKVRAMYNNELVSDEFSSAASGPMVLAYTR